MCRVEGRTHYTAPRGERKAVNGVTGIGRMMNTRRALSGAPARTRLGREDCDFTLEPRRFRNGVAYDLPARWVILINRGAACLGV